MKRPFLESSHLGISEIGAKNGTKIVPEGTIFLLVRGMTLLKEIPVCMSKKTMAFNQDVKAVVANKDVNNKYLFYYLTAISQSLRRYVEKAGHGTGRLSTEYINEAVIKMPGINEQNKIVEILSTWDKAIEQTSRLIEAKRTFKKALMQQLLTGKKRFPGFTGSGISLEAKYYSVPADWEHVQMSDIAHEASIRNKGNSNINVLSCTKHDGLVESLKYFGRQVFSKDTSNYKIVYSGQFAYATNHIEEGSVGYLDFLEKGLISPMYTVFGIDGNRAYGPYLYKLFKTELFRHIFEVNTSASVNRRGSLRWKEFSLIRIPLPGIEEQRRISDVIDLAQHEIDITTLHLEKLKQQKKGLMQKLLTGQVRVNV